MALPLNKEHKKTTEGADKKQNPPFGGFCATIWFF
jgi:hypothetical protein